MSYIAVHWAQCGNLLDLTHMMNKGWLTLKSIALKGILHVCNFCQHLFVLLLTFFQLILCDWANPLCSSCCCILVAKPYILSVSFKSLSCCPRKWDCVFLLKHLQSKSWQCVLKDHFISVSQALVIESIGSSACWTKTHCSGWVWGSCIRGGSPPCCRKQSLEKCCDLPRVLKLAGGLEP